MTEILKLERNQRKKKKKEEMDPKIPKKDKLVRRTAMVATITASYFLLTADYGPQPNVLDPIKNMIQTAESSVKRLIFGSDKDSPESESEPKK